MIAILKELWPFILEFFIKNPEIKNEVKGSGFLARMLVLFFLLSGIAYGGYLFYVDVLNHRYDRGKRLDEQLAFVDEVTSDLRKEKEALEQKYKKLDYDHHKARKQIYDLSEQVKNYTEGNRILSIELNKCVNGNKGNSLGKLNSTLKKPKEKNRRSVIKRENNIRSNANKLLGGIE